MRIADKIRVIPSGKKLTLRNLFMSPNTRSYLEAAFSQNFWILLSTFQLLHCIPLLNVKVTSNLVNYIRPINFSLINFNILNQVAFIESFNSGIGNIVGSDETSEAYKKMRIIGNHGTGFMENYYMLLVFLFIFAICHASLVFLLGVTNETNTCWKLIKNTLSKIMNGRTYMLLLMYSALPVTLAIVAQLHDYDINLPLSMLSVVFAVIVM